MGRAKQATSKARPQNWSTPQPLFLELERRFGRGGFTLDAAADDENTKCKRYLHEEEDALEHDWGGGELDVERVWVNPPLADIRPWVEKALSEVEEGRAEVVVMLLPARTGQAWFHDVVLPHAEVHFLRGRVNFVPPPGSDVKRRSPFEDSMVVVFSKRLDVSGL